MFTCHCSAEAFLQLIPDGTKWMKIAVKPANAAQVSTKFWWLQLVFKSPVLKPAKNRWLDRTATILDRTAVLGPGGLVATRSPVHVIF